MPGTYRNFGPNLPQSVVIVQGYLNNLRSRLLAPGHYVGRYEDSNKDTHDCIPCLAWSELVTCDDTTVTWQQWDNILTTNSTSHVQ